MATWGSTPKILPHRAASRAISTRSSSVGLMLMAQSPITRTSLPPVAEGRTMIKQEETILLPGLVLMSCRAGTHGVGGGIGGAAQQSVGLAHLHQHGAEVIALLQVAADLLLRHLALAQLHHLLNHLLHAGELRGPRSQRRGC